MTKFKQKKKLQVKKISDFPNTSNERLPDAGKYRHPQLFLCYHASAGAGEQLPSTTLIQSVQWLEFDL